MTATASPKRSTKRPAVCGVRAISGTRTMAERPRSSAAATARRYTSVLPLPVTPCSSRGAPGVSKRARIRRSAAAWALVSSTFPARAPTRSTRGRRGGCAAFTRRTNPRRSRLRSVEWSAPARRATAVTAAGPLLSVSSAARWRCPSRVVEASAWRPSSVSAARSERRGITGRPDPVPVPGGSTSARPRAGVDTYSRATHRPRPTSASGTSASSAASGWVRRSRAISLSSASPTTTPSNRRRPKGTTSTLPTLTLSRSPVSR